MKKYRFDRQGLYRASPDSEQVKTLMPHIGDKSEAGNIETNAIDIAIVRRGHISSNA
jgi:hypothetical protein